ncbi:MAG: lasso peptide biosynthesis B2 protein [Pseudomonadota bacterium]
MSKFWKFLRLPRQRRAVLAEAAYALTWSQVQLKARPFREVAKAMGRETGAYAQEGDAATLDEARELARAVKTAARALPTGALCLAKALALRKMLDRRGIPTACVIGVRASASPDDLDAHAWVEVAGEIIIGGARSRGYSRLVTYV